MGSRVRIRLFHLHFVVDFLFPLLKNSESGVDDRGHLFRSGSPLTNYPHAQAIEGRHHGKFTNLAWKQALTVKTYRK